MMKVIHNTIMVQMVTIKWLTAPKKTMRKILESMMGKMTMTTVDYSYQKGFYFININQ